MIPLRPPTSSPASRRRLRDSFVTGVFNFSESPKLRRQRVRQHLQAFVEGKLRRAVLGDFAAFSCVRARRKSGP